MKNKILVFGKNGQLGSELTRILPEYGDVSSYDFPEVDFLNTNSLTEMIRKNKPNLIINAATYTNVDDDETDMEKAYIVNGEAVGKIAETASEVGAGLIHYSTDYVFDGRKGSSYTENDIPNPISIYGDSKLTGEILAMEKSDSVVVFRTSWVYSISNNSFVTKVLRWARKNETLRIVDDQVSSPTWASSLARMSAELIGLGGNDIGEFLREKRGVYHLAGKCAVSRFDWAKKILELDPNKAEQIVKEMQRAKTSDFPTPATRPLYSVLDCSKFESSFGIYLIPWEENLKLAMMSWRS